MEENTRPSEQTELPISLQHLATNEPNLSSIQQHTLCSRFEGKYGWLDDLDYVEEHRFPAAYHRASRRTRRCHCVKFVPTLQLLSSRICGEKYEWRALNRLLVVQTGVSASQAKVFKAHAEPQGLCKNLINALKLLANQQKDGDSPIQSIVTGLCERSRTGIMEGLRNFIKVENHSALDVGHLEEGIRPFEVRRLKFKEGCAEASIREGLKELTLRAEEVGSQKSRINVDHIAEDRWDRPWLTLTGIPFAKQSTKELKAANGRNCTSNTKK